MASEFKLNAKQVELLDLMRMPEVRVLLARGGSRSSKTFGLIYGVVERALIAPKTRHAILHRFGTRARATLFKLTFRQVLDLAWPNLWEKLKLEGDINETDMTVELPNGSVIRFGGLDDSTRQDKILGDEYNTIMLNEVTLFNSFDIVEMAQTRLSQEGDLGKGMVLSPMLLMDCNPTTQRHWTYKAFILKQNPADENGKRWKRPERWAEMLLNPQDNKENISSDYIEQLEEMSGRKRQRFLLGEWQADNDDAIFDPDWLCERLGELPLDEGLMPDVNDFVRVVVAVDPAGSSAKGSDETGIVVLGKDADGHAHVLADLSGRYKPDEWSERACRAFHDYRADCIIAEKNYGGEMVAHTIETADDKVPVETVTATRGKTIRAEPIANAYKKGLVHHRGHFKNLVEQMLDFTIDYDRKRNGSPDRLDALVWGLTDLLLGEVKSTAASGGKVGGFLI